MCVQIDKLETAHNFTTREKESLAEEVARLRSQKEDLLSQQAHWDEFRNTSEQVQTLVALMQRADDEEVTELKRARERLSALEAENASLQRRFKDQESKMSSAERTAQTARQSLSQAQQRAAEWERRANEYEGELTAANDALEREEQTRKQLEEEHSMTRMQLEERDAEERLAKVCFVPVELLETG